MKHHYQKKASHHTKMDFVTAFTCFISLVAFEQPVVAQGTKTYQGAFKTKHITGTASYGYAPASDGSRVLQGPFRFTAADKQTVITGAFADNLKTGGWRIQLVNQLVPSLVVNYQVSGLATGTFVKGQLNGPWTVSKTITASSADNMYSRQVEAQLSNASRLAGGKDVAISGKQRTFTQTAKATFSQNRFTGAFSDSRPQDQATLIGQFSSEGYCTGSWTYRFHERGIPFTSVYVFNQGILTSSVTTNSSTGEVSRKGEDTGVLVAEVLRKLPPDSSRVMFNGTYYRLEETGPENFSGPVAKALQGWCGKGNLNESSLAFEVAQGAVPITRFPMRRLVADHEYAERRERAKSEAETAKLHATKDSLAVLARQREELSYTDYGILNSEIQQAYQQWSRKQEFETTEQVGLRIRQSGAAEFTKITTEHTAAAKARFLAKYRGLFAALDQYDADIQRYTIRLQQEDDRNKGLGDTIQVKMPLEVAKKLKQSFAGNNQPGERFHSDPVFEPTEAALVNNNWVVTRGVVLFNFSPAAARCLNELRRGKTQSSQLLLTGEAGYQLQCTYCACVNPIRVKSLIKDFPAASLEANIVEEKTPLNAVKTVSRSSTGVVGAGVVRAAVLGSNRPTIPSNQAQPTPIASSVAVAEVYQVEWSALQAANQKPFMPESLEVAP